MKRTLAKNPRDHNVWTNEEVVAGGGEERVAEAAFKAHRNELAVREAMLASNGRRRAG